MFKRTNDYLMTMDVEVEYALVEQLGREHGADLATVREAGLNSLIGHVRRAAQEAVRESGQRWKGDDVDAEGEWPRFHARFQGDTKGAETAMGLWGDKVRSLGGTRRILTASVRGSDGTNLQYMNEEYQQELGDVFDALPQEAQDKIDRLMTPDDD